MAKKIICEACGTAFKFELAKDMDICPVCGASLNDENEDITPDSNTKNDGIYFDEIHNTILGAYCGECEYPISPKLELFDKIVDKKYAISDSNITLKCKHCGREYTTRKILYKEKKHYAPPLPHCPVCNSVMLKKISCASKFAAAAMLGAFAVPCYNSKTYECKNCGYRF